MIRADDLANELSVANNGQSVRVSGPFADGDGAFYLATLRNGAHFRFSKDGSVRQLPGNFSVPAEAWDAGEAELQQVQEDIKHV